MRWMSAVVGLALLPSIAPDLFDLGCPHHLGHADAEGHARDAGYPGSGADHPGSGAGHPGPGADHPGPGADHAPAWDHLAALSSGHDAHDGTLPPPCTCIGSCPTSSGPSAPSGPAAIAPAFRATVSTRTTPTLERVAARRAPYTLPFANAPPLA